MWRCGERVWTEWEGGEEWCGDGRRGGVVGDGRRGGVVW